MAGVAVWNIAVWTDFDAPLLFKLWGLPFLFVGLYFTVGRFIVDARRRRRTIYVLTDRRAIILKRGWGWGVKSVWLAGIQDVHLDGGDGVGSITFGTRNPMALIPRSWGGALLPRDAVFEVVPDACEVYAYILQLRAWVAGKADATPRSF